MAPFVHLEVAIDRVLSIRFGWNDGDGAPAVELFGFLTTEANAIVAPVHPKAMPVILTTPDEVDLWLGAEPAADALALQRPLPDEALSIVAKGEKEDRAGEASAGTVT